MIVVRADRIFDGESLLDGATTVVIDGGRIVAVGGRDLHGPDGTVDIDFPGCTALPGLIDSHVHLCADSRQAALEHLPEHDDVALARMIEESLAIHLRTGVTTVRDLGDRRWAVLDWRASHPDSTLPRVIASGPPLTSPRGHCWNMGGEVAGADGIRAAVRERAARGVDVVKIMASGGLNTPGTDVYAPQFSLDGLRAAAEEAHALALPITAHAHAASAVALAVRAGVDGIEHGTFVTEAGVDVDPAVVDAIVARGIVVCPTLGVRPGVEPPPVVQEAMRRAGISPESRARDAADLHRAGVRLAAGTDGGINPGKCHGILPHALDHLAAAGVSAVDVLASATSVAADACGVGGRTGRLRAGLDADVLVVRGDPTRDTAALRSIAAVFLRGTQVS